MANPRFNRADAQSEATRPQFKLAESWGQEATEPGSPLKNFISAHGYLGANSRVIVSLQILIE
jgi:hypothetical protein